jgi:hypothetical protein
MSSRVADRPRRSISATSGLRDSYRRLLELEFEHLLLAHGEPLASGGRDALREFAER